MIQISSNIAIAESEIEFIPIRAQGSGGQKVNKTSSAIHLRFDIVASSLPERIKSALIELKDKRISSDNIVVIKAQQYRTQEQNRDNAIERLVELINSAMVVEKPRRPTRPSKGVKRRRLDSKTRRGKIKADRRKPDF